MPIILEVDDWLLAGSPLSCYQIYYVDYRVQRLEQFAHLPTLPDALRSFANALDGYYEEHEGNFIPVPRQGSFRSAVERVLRQREQNSFAISGTGE